jgi:hypothetical protein
MPRIRQYASNAERQAAYRARKAGIVTPQVVSAEDAAIAAFNEGGLNLRDACAKHGADYAAVWKRLAGPQPVTHQRKPDKLGRDGIADPHAWCGKYYPRHMAAEGEEPTCKRCLAAKAKAKANVTPPAIFALRFGKEI